MFACAVVCLVSGLLFFWRAFTAPQPIVDLRAFSDRNFASGCVASFVLGIGLYGLTYLYPVYLARVRGYSALMIGETMFVSGLCMFATAPIAGASREGRSPHPHGDRLRGLRRRHLDRHRPDQGLGFLGAVVAAGLRGCSLMLCMIPINNIALGTLPPARMKNASGLYNLTRNLGVRSASLSSTRCSTTAGPAPRPPARAVHLESHARP